MGVKKRYEAGKRYKQAYYKKTSKYGRKKWTKEEDSLVMEHKISDRELSELIERSMMSITMRRYRLNGGKY